jgi:hypothetical protein
MKGYPELQAAVRLIRAGKALDIVVINLRMDSYHV